MQYKKVLIERTEQVGVIRLNDPERLNATTYELLEELDAAFTELATSARAIVLTGAGRAFCAGGDLDSLKRNESDVGIGLESHVNPLLSKLRGLAVPWITSVRGAAVGLGCALALAADLIIASENAYFTQAFSRVGLVPDGGSTYLLTRGLTRARAMEMMLLGDKVPAQKALEWGLINRVVADELLEETSREIALRLAVGPTAALRSTRRGVWDALDSTWEPALRAEREAQRAAGLTADFKEGLASLLEKRAPRFRGS